MIKPINITPLNTSTHPYFHCINCGFKEEITISLVNTDNNYEMEMLKQINCPYCGVSLGTTGLPNLDNLEIIKLSKQLFSDKGDTHPTLFYMDLLFNDRSSHSQSKKFSGRMESLAQFLTDKGRHGPDDSGVVAEIFSKTLRYFLSEGYLSENEYKKEYETCMQIWNKYFFRR